MTEREQLIKLLWEAIRLRDGICRIIGRRRVEEIADYLLKNGVVISVRCKDCKWWHDMKCTNINGANCLVMNENWFCCSGERKDKCK